MFFMFREIHHDSNLFQFNLVEMSNACQIEGTIIIFNAFYSLLETQKGTIY
jgi:hypothetical protein